MSYDITAHVICKNEEKWIWFSLMSVIDYVDRIIIYDTGSTDKTKEIIKLINNPKIELTEFFNVNAEEFTKLRQKQIEETTSKWIMILDADEIWEEKMFKKILERIKDSKENVLAVFTHWFEFVNDINHYYMGIEQQQYPLHNRKEYGWYMLRFFRNLKEIYCDQPYGSEGYFIKNKELQRFGKSEDYIWGNDIYFFHARNLIRSSDNSKDKEVMLRVEKRHLNKIGIIKSKYRGLDINAPSIFKKFPENIKNEYLKDFKDWI